MTWSRALFAATAADMLKEAPGVDTVNVFPAPPLTLNPPALVVGHPLEVLYGTAALGVDEATIPIVCVGPLGGEDTVDALLELVREVFAPGVMVDGVQSCVVTAERNWGPARIGGAELLVANAELTVRM
jgi:hypothetical protein